MQKFPFTVCAFLSALFLTGCATSANAQAQEPRASNSQSSENCPVTTPGGTPFEPSIPSLPTTPFQGEFWHGSEHLWTSLPDNGTWAGLPLNPDGYTQKIFWWSEFFSAADEPEPALVVFGERLDEDAPPLIVSKATNAFATDIGSAMLVGVDFPTAGCWEITGQYKKAGLTFVIRVTP